MYSILPLFKNNFPYIYPINKQISENDLLNKLNMFAKKWEEIGIKQNPLEIRIDQLLNHLLGHRTDAKIRAFKKWAKEVFLTVETNDPKAAEKLESNLNGLDKIGTTNAFTILLSGYFLAKEEIKPQLANAFIHRLALLTKNEAFSETYSFSVDFRKISPSFFHLINSNKIQKSSIFSWRKTALSVATVAVLALAMAVYQSTKNIIIPPTTPIQDLGTDQGNNLNSQIYNIGTQQITNNSWNHVFTNNSNIHSNNITIFMNDEVLKEGLWKHNDNKRLDDFERTKPKGSLVEEQGKLHEQSIANPQNNATTGEIENHKFNGQSEGLWQDGIIPQRELQNGKLGGQGKITLQDGTVHEGEFIDGKLYRGKIFYNTKWGSYAEGEFVDGKLNGQGKRFDGLLRITFEGEFKDDKLHGRGEISKYDGILVKGEFKNGYLNGQGEITWHGGTVAKGDFRDNKLNGEGEITWGDGTIANGIFQDGKLIEGEVKYYYLPYSIPLKHLSWLEEYEMPPLPL